jgi:hypothetical protein
MVLSGCGGHVNRGVPIVDCRLQIVDSRIVDWRLPIWIGDWRLGLPIAECRLANGLVGQVFRFTASSVLNNEMTPHDRLVRGAPDGMRRR